MLVKLFLKYKWTEKRKIKRAFQRIFKSKELDIVIQCNVKVVDYLDATLNLNNGSFKLFVRSMMKQITSTRESDHPPNIIKQLPIAVEKRISDLSSSEEIFVQSMQYD